MGVTKRCRTCKYVANLSGQYACDYLLITAEPRGCKAGDKCTKYEKKGGKRQVRIDFATRR